MSDITSVRRKIQSLLRMTAPNSGATEAERFTAQNLIGKLMRKYGITEAQLNERDRISVVFTFGSLSSGPQPTFSWGFSL